VRGPLAGARLRLPIRLKLAAVSGGLTFVILLAFALVVGGFTEQKLQSSFDSDLRAAAADLQSEFQVNGFGSEIDINQFRAAAAGGAVLRVWNRVTGRVYALNDRPRLGPLYEGIRDVGDYRVIARPLFVRSLTTTDSFDRQTTPTRPFDGAVAAIQYAKPTGNLNATIDRVRFFLLLGVVIGTVFAFLVGLWVARRAMRPISGLTRAAREVARTRDPARTVLPRPVANDEIADLSTTLSEMLAELAAARSESDATLERQREFVADASHELRTPLTSILANLELLQEELERPAGPRDSGEAAEIAGSALRSSQRMRRLVGDLLLLARADAGRRERLQTIDLAEVAREAAREAAAIGGEHSLTLDLPEESGVALVDGTRDDLHRLVLNLVENAFLHTPSGTPVIASVRRDTTSSGGAGGDRVRLEVADRGPGVPSDQRERVFERFARTESDRSTVSGTGLGLAIVRAVAEAHGGSATVRDAEGGGALFEIDLPAALQTAANRVQSAESSQPTVVKGARQP
jgi:two-component system, OmpR family, sensor kinase